MSKEFNLIAFWFVEDYALSAYKYITGLAERKKEELSRLMDPEESEDASDVCVTFLNNDFFYHKQSDGER